MITHTKILLTDSLDPHLNLASEDALLQALPKDQALLYLWRNKHTVVIGAGQNAWRECNTQLLEQEGGTLARRSSGGGAVYHDLGNLNFSFLVPREDYCVERQLRVVLDALGQLGIEAQSSGRNDLTASGRKFSGNAFRLLKGSALHHGTLLVNVDTKLMGRYLNVDEEKMRAKGVQSVRARVVNLNELAPVTVESAHDALIDAFQREYGPAAPETLVHDQLPGLRALLPRYRDWNFNYGASPVGEVNLWHRFDWGSLELSFTVRSGHIQDLLVFTDAMDETLSMRLQALLQGARYSAESLSKCTQALDCPGLCEYLARIGV